jgi:hypothetical protein
MATQIRGKSTRTPPGQPRGGEVADLDVVLGGVLEEALDAGARVLGALHAISR